MKYLEDGIFDSNPFKNRTSNIVGKAAEALKKQKKKKHTELLENSIESIDFADLKPRR